MTPAVSTISAATTDPTSKGAEEEASAAAVKEAIITTIMVEAGAAAAPITRCGVEDRCVAGVPTITNSIKSGVFRTKPR